MEPSVMGRISIPQEVRDGLYGRWTTITVSDAFENLMWTILEDADHDSTDEYLQDAAVLADALSSAHRSKAGRTVVLCEHGDSTWAILYVLTSEAEWREYEAREAMGEAWDASERALRMGQVRTARTMAARVAEARRALFEVQP